jgi:CBS domain-containing protein
MNNTSIATLLAQKGGAVHTVPTTVTVLEAVQEMNRHKIGSVLVMNGLRLAGIFTERDVLLRVVGAELDPLTTPIAKVMTADVLTIAPDTSVQDVMNLFAEKRCRHLPVVKNGQLIGLVSIGDVSRWVANADRAEAESLRQYIGGGLSA